MDSKVGNIKFIDRAPQSSTVKSFTGNKGYLQSKPPSSQRPTCPDEQKGHKGTKDSSWLVSSVIKPYPKAPAYVSACGARDYRISKIK